MTCTLNGAVTQLAYLMMQETSLPLNEGLTYTKKRNIIELCSKMFIIHEQWR